MAQAVVPGAVRPVADGGATATKGKTMRSPVHALVRNLDLFKGLPEREAEDVLAEARLRKVAEGSSVFVQGAPALRFYMLAEGRLKIVQTTPEGQQIIAHWVAPGQFFGLAAALGRDDYPGTATAVTGSTVLAWPMTAWEKLAFAHPAVAEAALRTIGGHLQEAFARLREVSAERVEQRIARALLRLVRQSGQRTEQGVQIEFPITRQDIAEMTSTTLYTVSRTLSAWEQAGVLTGGRRRIVVLDPHALVRFAGEE